MALPEPTTMEEMVYFTNRALGAKGNAKAWVFRNKCPKCRKGLMGKPIDPKTGRFKTRSSEYECPDCGYNVEGKEYEETLEANIEYICPHCEHHGEIQMPFIRKKVRIENPETGKKKTVESLRFECASCKGKIDVTKKMKK